jgi:hypothetical protein
MSHVRQPWLRSGLRPTAESRRSAAPLNVLLRRWLAVALVLLGVTTAGSPATAATAPILLGAVGDVGALSKSIGAPLATHAYGYFNQSVPQGRMISVKASGTWAQTAAASPGSPLYNDIVRWANTIKARPGRTMLAFNHEPEASGNTSRGTSQDFIRAWRRVVDIFRKQGVTNVDFTLQMTDWSYRTSVTDPRHVSKWYPGDAYVDVVGADAYNWYTCGHGKGRWVELKTLTDPVISFARTHRKKASLPEFASFTNSRRADWVRNAHQYLAANRDIVVAAFYFQHPPTNGANSDCVWKLNTSAEYKAYGDMARNTSVFRSS